jgi:hypothetical protein
MGTFGRWHSHWRMFARLAPVFALLIAAANADEPQSTVRSVRFTLVLENPTGKPMLGKKMWLYGPAARSPTQSLQRLDIDTPHVAHTDARGNTIVELGPLDLAPYQTRVIAVAARLAVSATPPSSRDPRPDRQLVESQPFIESDDPRVAALAKTLQGRDAMASARAIYEWVRHNLSYAGYIADELGARYALEHRTGDCTEYADLAAALARSLGIPARVLGGYVVESDAVLRAADYHNWTELWLGDRWVLLDAQKEHFGEAAEQYIAFHILGSQSEDSMQGAERFRADEGLVVRWN